MKRFLLLTVVLSSQGFYAAQARAHGLPIDLFVNSETGRLFVLENFEPAELTAGIGISTDSPGLGVSFPSNGLASGTAIGLDVTQELLYWNGATLELPSVSLWLDNPAQTATYTVSATSGLQNGMNWATYPGGSFWDAHGLYSFVETSAPAGVYGVAMRITSPSYGSAKPFLLPLIYDPVGQWNAAEISDGIELLREAIAVPFDPDFDGDTHIDGADFLAWQRGFGPAAQTTVAGDGDADFDSDVDYFDLAFWEQGFGVVPASSLSQPLAVPEPASIFLALASWFVAMANGRRGRAIG